MHRDMDTKSWKWQVVFKCEDGNEHDKYAVMIEESGNSINCSHLGHCYGENGFF